MVNVNAAETISVRKIQEPPEPAPADGAPWRAEVQYRGRSRVATVITAAIHGVEGVVCRVEVCLMQGLPYVDIVGGGDRVLREAPDRIRAAIRMAGYRYPDTRMTINLSPAWLPKRGSAFDLPIALAILIASGQLRAVREVRAFGELSLDGTVKPVPGAYVLAEHLADATHLCLVPEANFDEVCLHAAEGRVPCTSLQEAAAFLEGKVEVPAKGPTSSPGVAAGGHVPDLAEIRGQSMAVEGMILAAAGGHHSLLTGSPGCGKSLLARSLIGILPEPTGEARREIAAIRSVSGRFAEGIALPPRPFRAPHFSITRTGLLGGGARPAPGEITLAHHGVLFLDELTHFSAALLTALLEPLDARALTISRMRERVTYPASFLLVAACNPCPCGQALEEGCRCSPGMIRRHRQRLIGPLLDRVDIRLTMQRVPSEELNETVSRRSARSPEVRKNVAEARRRQYARHEAAGLGTLLNRDVEGPRMREVWKLSDSILRLAQRYADRLALSVRGFQTVLRLARTVADLAGREDVGHEDLELALHFYRPVKEVAHDNMHG